MQGNTNLTRTGFRPGRDEFQARGPAFRPRLDHLQLVSPADAYMYKQRCCVAVAGRIYRDDVQQMTSACRHRRSCPCTAPPVVRPSVAPVQCRRSFALHSTSSSTVSVFVIAKSLNCTAPPSLTNWTPPPVLKKL